jgi:sugar O-acyltransferase (sialic acid O-acetyltransferase NeuD family)
MKKKINIFGAGEVYIQIKPLLKENNIEINEIFDDIKNPIKKIVKEEFLYCVGYKDMNSRYRRYNELKIAGIKFANFFAENAIVSEEEVKIGNGTIVNQGAIIDNYVEIGECVFINIGAMISHHSKVADNVFIAPGANIAGYVEVGEGVFVGCNSTIIDHIKIGEYSLIAAGAVVIEDVPPYSMVAGNPAKIKKYINQGV